MLSIEAAPATIAELPLFDGGVYPASVRAIDPVVALFINKNDFRSGGGFSKPGAVPRAGFHFGPGPSSADPESRRPATGIRSSGVNMPIIIGAKRESDFTDPIGMLGDCHRRIERFLSVLKKLATERQGVALGEQEQNALSTSLRYFREAAPKHTADEEESLFPRMRAADPAATGALFERIDALESEHKTAVKMHAEVDVLGQAWLSRGQLSSDEASRLVALLGQLTTLYERHIALEDSEVFPSAARLLSTSDSQAIGLEMAARRGLGTK